MNSTWGGTIFAGGQVRVDLGALIANYRLLQDHASPAEVAAVVKADAYGLGAEPVTAALSEAGCRHFFVAHLDEALVVRRAVQDAEVYILNGLWPGAESVAEAGRLIPVLNSLGQLERWRDLALSRRRCLPCVIQVDSGMARLGLSPDHVNWLADNPQVFEDLDVRYVMSHLACADVPSAAANGEQHAALVAAMKRLPRRPVSLANSAATLSQPGSRGDLVRCGIGLYGGAPFEGTPNPMWPVVELTARIIQVRTVPAGAGVGYGHTYVADIPRRIATVSIGYGDGVPRRLGGRAAVFAGDARLPIVGRISMDSLMVDATHLPAGELQAGDVVELIGMHQTLDDLAHLSDTISYEILTNLSRRVPRLYVRTDGAA